MKQLNRFLAVLLAFTVLIQCSPISFAEGGSGALTQEIDGVVYTQNADGTVTAVFLAGEPTVCTARRSPPRGGNSGGRHLAPVTRRGAKPLSLPPEDAALKTKTEGTVGRDLIDIDDDPLNREESLSEELALTVSEPNGDVPAQNEPVEGEIAAPEQENQSAEETETIDSTIPEHASMNEDEQVELESEEQDASGKAEESVPTEPTSETEEEQADSVTLFPATVPGALIYLSNHAIIHSFSLYTYAAQASGNNIFSAHRIDDVWSHASVAYDTLPAFAGQPLQTKNVSSPGWLTWDLTSLAAAWFGGNSCGLLIRGEGGVGDLDLSSTQVESPAYYVVTYTPLMDSVDQELNLRINAYSNSNSSKFGYVELSWTPVPWADGYTVAVYNGQEYEYFPAGNSSFWSTENKGIWPTAEEAKSGSYQLHHDGAGAELLTGLSEDSKEGSTYFFKLIPTNQYGQMPDVEAFTAKAVSFDISTENTDQLYAPMEPRPEQDNDGQAVMILGDQSDKQSGNSQAVSANPHAGGTGGCPRGGAHVFVYGTTVPATCTEGGYDVYVCDKCGTTEQRNHTAALGHSYDFTHPVSSSAATCTEASYASYDCLRCGERYTYEVSGPLGHNYEYNYEPYSKNQHSAYGVCSRCGEASAVSYEPHADANNDHICDRCGYADYPDPTQVKLQVTAHGNGINSCTGYLELSWNTVSDATAYYVALFNGEVYEYISVGNVTTWSTQGRGIWPTEAEIVEGRFRLHTQGGGAELNMLPALSYTNAGSEHAGDLYYYVSVIPANAAGYAKQPPAETVKSIRLPDTVPPSQASSVLVEPDSYTNADTVLLKWEGITDYNDVSGSAVSDLVNGNVQYCLDDGESWLETGISTGTGYCQIDVSALADGIHAVSLRAVDGAGNTGSPQSAQIFIDRTPPSVPEATIIPTGWSNADSAALTWSGIADLTDLSRVEYAFDGGDYISTGIAEKEYVGFPIELSSLSDGEHLLSLRAVDLAGNVGEACKLSVLRDTQAPTFESLTLTPDSWTNGIETALSWEGLADNNSGVRLVEYRVDDGEAATLPIKSAWSETLDIASLTDGGHLLTVSLEDNAGNREEHNLSILRDVTLPEIELFSPSDGDAANGIVEVWGSVSDLSLAEWQVLAVREDGSERVLATGGIETDAERMAMLNCSAYEDGESVELRITARDHAGNSNTISGTVIIIDKSAVPISNSVTVTAPADKANIDTPRINGSYTLDDGATEKQSLLYIDGVYAGPVSGGSFVFDAIRYDENTMHSLSVITWDESGTVGFSQGLSAVTLLADAFEDASYLTSSSGVELSCGATLRDGNGSLISQSVLPAYPILAFRLSVAEKVPAGAEIKYFYSLDGGTSWTAFAPDTDIPLYAQPDSLTVKAELSGAEKKPVLCGWTLSGVIESRPVRILVRLLRPVEELSLASTTVSRAITELVAIPEGCARKAQYKNGTLAGEDFRFDARAVPDGTKQSIALAAETEDGIIYGSGAKATLLLRESVGESGSVSTPALKAEGKLYAIRLEALSQGTVRFSYSTDGSVWQDLPLRDYLWLSQPAEQLYLRAEPKDGGRLLAWHAEGVTCTESTVTVQIMSAPVNVTAAEYGPEYYANEKLRRYDLSWSDPMAPDETASYTTTYEIIRDGNQIAVTDSTRYTDTAYVPNAHYEVRTLRTYEGFEPRTSAYSAAATVRMKAPETVNGVDYSVSERKQSEYLNKLYGGSYTFTNEPRIPGGEEILLRALLGRVNLCAYGLEPINFNTGNFLLETVDLDWIGPGESRLTLTRTYNTQSPEKDGPFGAKWSSPLAEHLLFYTEGDVLYCAEGGAQIAFRRTADGAYSGGEIHNLRLEATENEYRVTDADGVIHAFTGVGLLKSLQWPDGNRVEFTRDGDGLLTGAQLPGGEHLEIECDRNGHITAIVGLGGSTLKFAYDGKYLSKVTDASGAEIRYVYDGMGRMTEWYDAAGNRQVRNSYDSRGRVIRQLDANGGEATLAYFDDHTVITDAEGTVSEVWFDAEGRTTKTVDANGAEIAYEYDQNSNIIAITDALGNTTHYEYDALGNKTRETAADGSSYSLQYDENNNLTRLTDQLGGVTLYEYDERNRLVKQMNPDGGVTAYTYNDMGQVLTVADPMGNVTAYEYDGVDLIKSTDPNGNATSYDYDTQHRLIATTDALGNTTAFVYDGQDNLTSATFADGTSFAYEYDKVGNLIAQTDALGNVTRYEYDALRQLVKTTYPDGSESTSVYNHSGNLISAVDANGGTAAASYDGRGNLLTLTDALGNTTSYAYDLKGSRVLEIDPRGGETRYHYDAVGRVANMINPAGEMTSYTYDAAGNLRSVTAPDNGVTKYGYDTMGRLLSETDPNGGTMTYAYDKAGRLVTKTDTLGNTTTYTYDANGNLLTITDALGGVTSYTYDVLNRAVSMTDANGAITSYTYDAVGKLVSQTDALGAVTTYAYDGNGSITGLTDALGGKSAMSYDELGNVIAVLQKNSGTVNAAYDPLGHLLTETDALGNTTAYEYDANGKVTKITDALGQSAEIAYDATGNVTHVGAPDGSETSYAYDLAGRILSETSATGAKTGYTYESGRLTSSSVNGNETRFTYDLAGNITSVTDAEGRKVELNYDALGNLTAVLYPDGTQDAYEYDALSRLIKYTPREGDATAYTYNAMGDVLTVTVGNQTTSYEYDLLGRMIATITADGARTEAVYDALGNTVKTTDALGNATSYSYTVDSLLKEIRYANGATLTANYDLVGNLTAETDPEGNATAYEYDPVGRMTAVTDALGNTTRYEYDAADNLAKVTDALGHVTSYTYDALGNLTSETDALGNTVMYSYTPEGWLETVTDAEGHVTRYTYDRTGNVLTADYAGEQTETNTYNELGLLTTVTEGEGDTLYQYDDASRLLSVTQPNGETVSYTYDSHGNRATMTYPNGKTVKYTYDDMNRLVSVKGVDGETTKYSYDALGRRIATDGAKEDTVYTYDEVGNLVSQTTTGAYDLALEYAYDLSGRMTQESRTENGATLTSSYIYDALGQLTSFTRSDGQSETYTYDPVGNMTAKTQNGVSTAMKYNAGNQLIQSVTGNDTTKYTYDANGNLVRSENAGGARSYAYNALGLLAKLTREDGYTEAYTYNANRLLSSIKTSEDLTTALTWDILYGDGVVISTDQNGKTTNYTYGLERISALSGSTRTEYVYDGRGSVAAEVSYNNAWYTFGGGLARKNVTAKSYTPFGEQIGEATSGFGYNGEYYNAATGMIYLRARFYAPEMNRFGQKDLQFFVLNEYIYCFNDPVNFVDINGREAIVVSGGDYNDRGELFGEKLNSYNFITTALRDIELAKANSIDEKITWIIADEGWTDADKQSFSTAVNGLGVNIQYINDADQLTSYINTGSVSADNIDTVSQGRLDNPITYMSVFSHGLQNGNISLGYNYMNNYNTSLDVDESTVSQWNKAAFSSESPAVESAIKLFSCRPFKGEDDSLGAFIAAQTGLDTYGYSGKSEYGYTVLSVVTPKNIKDYFYWRYNEQSKTFWGYIADSIMIPTVYQPIASSNNSTPYRATADGTVSTTAEIPDLASNKTTGYIQSTPSKPSNILNKTSIKETANSIKNFVAAKVAPQVTKTATTVNTAAQAISNTIRNVYNTAKNIFGGILR